jgi:pimeloyl-ACP methyl ester carboxylesterase
VTTTDWTSETTGIGEYAEVNGIRLYYETHGSGRPLILLHGGLGSGEMFGPLLPLLAKDRKVIAVDLQGHGRTADIDRPIDLRFMGDDVAALVDHLGLGTTDVMGYSLGGGVALQVAVRHPRIVERLVLVSAFLRRASIYPAVLAAQGQVNADAVAFMKDTPMYQLYQRVAPRPEDFPKLLDKVGASMARDFDYSEAFQSLTMPTLVAGADADMVPPSAYVEMFALLGGGQQDGGWMGEGRPAGGHALAIIPGTTHYDVFMSPVLAAAALAFLDGART